MIEENKSGFSLLRAWVLLALAALCFEAFFITGPAYMDDYLWFAGARNVTENPSLIFSFPAPIYYRPAALALATLEYITFGPSPVLFRIVTLCLHAGIIGLLLLLAWRLTGDRLSAVLAAVFFIFSAGNSMAIWWVAAQSGVLAALAVLACLIMWCRLRDTGSPLAATGVAVTAIVAVLAKEEAYPLPFVLLVLDRFGLRAENENKTQKPRWRYAVWGFITIFMLIVATYSITKYIKMIQTGWISHLPGIYAVPNILSGLTQVLLGPATMPYWAAVFFIPVLIAALLLIPSVRKWALDNLRRTAFPALAVILFLASPAFIRHSGFLEEHFMYAPSIYIAIILGMAVRDMLRGSRERKMAVIPICVAALIVFGALNRIEIDKVRKLATKTDRLLDVVKENWALLDHEKDIGILDKRHTSTTVGAYIIYHQHRPIEQFINWYSLENLPKHIDQILFVTSESMTLVNGPLGEPEKMHRLFPETAEWEKGMPLPSWLPDRLYKKQETRKGD
ncbi:MAG: hypothetical protein ACYS8W_08890 [Planctomycetota bacterium]|jgi:hypothetical protein